MAVCLDWGPTNPEETVEMMHINIGITLPKVPALLQPFHPVFGAEASVPGRHPED